MAPTLRSIDATDRRILLQVQANGKSTIGDLSRIAYLSSTPCHARLKRLEEHGYIRSYVALLNPQLLGNACLAYAEIALSQSTAESIQIFKDAVVQVRAILECHQVAGSFDFLAKIRTMNLETYRQILRNELSQLPGVATIRSHMVLDEVKATHAIEIGEVS